MSPTQQEVHDAYGKLYKSLTDAFWVASTITDKDRIRGAADAVLDIITALNQEDIRSREAEFATLKSQVDIINNKLAALQKDIDGIIHNVTVATTVVQTITKALDFGAKFFA